MSTALDQRSPVAKAGWLIGLFLVGWLAFLFVPWPWRAPPSEPMPRMVVRPPSKLQAAGLKDNPDWDGLPELFAVWADHAGWKDDKAQFAYWNPGSHSYSYFFEATRAKGLTRFRSLSKTELDGAASLFAEETEEWEKEGRPTEFASPEHPFVFFGQAVAIRRDIRINDPITRADLPVEKPSVQIELRPTPIPSPELVGNKPQESDAGHKK